MRDQAARAARGSTTRRGAWPLAEPGTTALEAGAPVAIKRTLARSKSECACTLAFARREASLHSTPLRVSRRCPERLSFFSRLLLRGHQGRSFARGDGLERLQGGADLCRKTERFSLAIQRSKPILKTAMPASAARLGNTTSMQRLRDGKRESGELDQLALLDLGMPCVGAKRGPESGSDC